MHRLALLVTSFVVLGCEPVLSADTVKLVQLPADLTTGPATAAVQTRTGHIFATPISGGFLRLGADGGAWDELPPPAMLRSLPDFQGIDTLTQGANDTLFRAEGEGFTALDVPPLTHEAFSSVRFFGVLGRDATGTFWAAAAPSFGAIDKRVFVARREVDAPSEWKVDEVPLANLGQTIAAGTPAMTSDARFFFRPANSGLWEIDLANHAVVERVSCDHELFRASGPDYTACQEDTVVFAGRGGELFLLTPNRELWRIAARQTLPELAVKGELPKLDKVTETGANRYGSIPDTYVDPKGRVWISFRWGENDPTDTSYLYVAEPAKRQSWTFLTRDLPRNMALFGEGPTPLISSGSQDTGLLLFRIVE